MRPRHSSVADDRTRQSTSATTRRYLSPAENFGSVRGDGAFFPRLPGGKTYEPCVPRMCSSKGTLCGRASKMTVYPGESEIVSRECRPGPRRHGVFEALS